MPKKVMSHRITDFSKLVNWCPVKHFPLTSTPVVINISEKTEIFRYGTLETSRKKAFTPANSVKLYDKPC